MTDSKRRNVFNQGDQCMLVDKRERRYLIKLEESSLFSTHLGDLSHDEMI